MKPALTDDRIRAWDRLAAEAGSFPTQDAAWALAGYEALPGEARMLTVGDPAAPSGVAPLIRRERVLELAGGSMLGEPSDLLYGDAASLLALAERIAGEREPFLLNRVAADSPTIEAVRKAFGSRCKLRISEAPPHPTIALDDRWKEPGGGLSSSRRSSLRRARRKAETLGELEFELLTPSSSEVDPVLDEAFAVESRSWKQEMGTAIPQVPAMEAFFRRYATELAARERLRIDLLRLDGKTIAMQLGTRWKNRHWLFKVAYDEEFAAASPGRLLLAESLAAAARDGLERYEPLGSVDRWTKGWTNDVRHCTRVLALPYSRRGALAFGSILRHSAEDRIGTAVGQRRERTNRHLAQRYMSGAERDDALRQEDIYAEAGYLTVVGFWSGGEDSQAKVLEEASAAAAALRPGSEVAIKLSSIGGDGEGLERLFERCRERQLTLHLDALGPDTATACLRTARRLNELGPGEVGCTLASRWSRSPADAAELRDSGLRVRIVKGEFPATAEQERDPTAGFLDVAAALAGGTCHVEVASRDPEIVAAALQRLTASGTSCEFQLLHNMGGNRALRVARRLGVPARVYVPYGSGRIPYSRGDLRRRPQLVATVIRDLLPIGPRKLPRV